MFGEKNERQPKMDNPKTLGNIALKDETKTDNEKHNTKN